MKKKFLTPKKHYNGVKKTISEKQILCARIAALL